MYDNFNISIFNVFQVNFSIRNIDAIEENDEILIDPFNALWKKLLGTVFYILQVFGGLIILSFVRYETQGHAAHFRTALNQITSWIALVVSFMKLLVP